MGAKKVRKLRKLNFLAAGCSLIQLGLENLKITREEFSNSLTNKKKKEVWQRICENVLGVEKRTTTEIRKKWRAICGGARNDIAREKKIWGDFEREATTRTEGYFPKNH